MSSKISVQENGLNVEFLVRDNGIVELADFTPTKLAGAAEAKEHYETNEDNFHPLLEVQITGKSTENNTIYERKEFSCALPISTTAVFLLSLKEQYSCLIIMKGICRHFPKKKN